MKAVSRLGYVLLAGALSLAPMTAFAQETPPKSDTPATDAIGPRELQNFSLNGTVTRAADQPPATQPAPPRRQPRGQAQSDPATAEPRAAPATSADTRIRPDNAPSPPAGWNSITRSNFVLTTATRSRSIAAVGAILVGDGRRSEARPRHICYRRVGNACY